MEISVGIAVGATRHWSTAIDGDGRVRLDGIVENTPAAFAGLASELRLLGGAVRIGLDVVGGVASLAEAILADAGFPLVHVQEPVGETADGERKADPRRARRIADAVRLRRDLPPIDPAAALDPALRQLVVRRRAMADARSRTLDRLRDLLARTFPALERRLDLTADRPLVLLTGFATAAELLAAGRERIDRHLRAGGLADPEPLTDKALAAAREQAGTPVDEDGAAARRVRQLAAEALAARARLDALDRELAALADRRPDVPPVHGRPGTGAEPIA